MVRLFHIDNNTVLFKKNYIKGKHLQEKKRILKKYLLFFFLFKRILIIFINLNFLLKKLTIKISIEKINSIKHTQLGLQKKIILRHIYKKKKRQLTVHR